MNIKLYKFGGKFAESLLWKCDKNLSSSGQASSENQEKANQGGEGAVETNSSISAEEVESVNFEEHVQGEASPMNEMPESVGNFLG